MKNQHRQLLVCVMKYIAIVIVSVLFLNSLFINFVLKKGKNYVSYEQIGNLDEVDVLVVGDSHLKNSVNPEYWMEVYNFAAGGEHYHQTLYKLKYVFEEIELNPSIVILSLNFHSFRVFDVESTSNVWYWGYFMSLNEMIKWRDKGDLLELFLSKYFPVIDGGEELISLFVGGLKEPFRGFVENYSLLENDDVESKNFAAQQKVKYHFEGDSVVDQMEVGAFEEVLEYLEGKNVEVILVRAPVSFEYFGYVSRYIPELSMFDVLASDVYEKHINVSFLDYYDYFFDKPELFSDPDHLNYEGARLFTKKLKNDIKDL